MLQAQLKPGSQIQVEHLAASDRQDDRAVGGFGFLRRIVDDALYRSAIAFSRSCASAPRCA
jgi:hypothetical protein